MKALVLVLVVACSGETPGTPVAPPERAVAKVPAAAGALARTFADEIAGTITPIAVTPDAYAMALALDFQTFPTMELRITERRTGAWRMTLANDGTAHACAGSRSFVDTDGQYHYERDPAKRQHSSHEDVMLAALTGTWSVVDGVAIVRLDRIGWGSCDRTQAVAADRPVELRCIGLQAPAMVSGKRLACVLGAQSQTFALGLPMTPESRTARGPINSAPAGNQLIFGAPGVVIVVNQGARDAVPAFTFTPGPVVVDEKTFQRQRPKP